MRRTTVETVKRKRMAGTVDIRRHDAFSTNKICRHEQFSTPAAAPACVCLQLPSSQQEFASPQRQTCRHKFVSVGRAQQGRAGYQRARCPASGRRTKLAMAARGTHTWVVIGGLQSAAFPRNLSFRTRYFNTPEALRVVQSAR